MRSVEQDRHRVAMQLHEEALGALAALGLIMQTSYAALPRDVSRPLNATLTDIRGGLIERTESLRGLMLAVRSPELDDQSLATSLIVLTSELYGETCAPEVSLTIDPELVLDWTTKTIVYRIAQEAIHNIWRHAQASRVDVSLQWLDDTLVLVIDDDGVGYDPAAGSVESGIATMQLFAGLGQGTVTVSRRDDGGTRARAVLGQHHPDPRIDDAHHRTGHLHLISGSAGSPSNTTDPVSP